MKNTGLRKYTVYMQVRRNNGFLDWERIHNIVDAYSVADAKEVIFTDYNYRVLTGELHSFHCEKVDCGITAGNETEKTELKVVKTEKGKNHKTMMANYINDDGELH